MFFSPAFFSIFLVNSAFAEVLLLGLGSDDNNYRRKRMDAVNIDSDLSNYGTYCSPLPYFPHFVSRSVGGLVNGQIVVCGGYYGDPPHFDWSQACYALGATGWEPIGNLTIPKYDAAAATLPNGDLWITGGRLDECVTIYNVEECGDIPLHSTDIVTANMEVIRGPDMQSNKRGHCVTQFNSTTMILVGGYDDPYRVDFFNVETQEWTNYGPRTKFEHVGAGCTSFIDTDGKEKVMVIGDYYDTTADNGKVEIFDGVSWEVLDDLSVPMGNVEAVYYKDKIIVTGNKRYDYLFTSWEFDIGTRTWTPGFQMNPPIENHISFLLPDSFCK